MANYRPQLDNTIPLKLIIPTYTTKHGVSYKTYGTPPTTTKGNDLAPSADIIIYGNFKTYGGTEKSVDGLYSIDDTAVIETWFRPDIKSDCRIQVIQTGAEYEIINEPENVNMRNQFLRFKVRRVKGGA